MPTLNWIGKDAVVNHHKEVPFRLLKCNEKLSVGDDSGNLLVQGDNLEEYELVATPDLSFTFDPEDYPYPPNSLFEGRHKFKKHYYKVIGDMKAEGEELQCALLLDNHPKVKRWVRNLEGRPGHSFWLQTSTDRFYPDFVCELIDGRFLVVEYKGFDRWSDDDSKEKRAIGQVWEEKSDGHCLFVMPKGPDWNAILAKLS